MTFFLQLGFVREADVGVGGAMRRVGKKKHIPAVGGVYNSNICSLKDWIASCARNDEGE